MLQKDLWNNRNKTGKNSSETDLFGIPKVRAIIDSHPSSNIVNIHCTSVFHSIAKGPFHNSTAGRPPAAGGYGRSNKRQPPVTTSGVVKWPLKLHLISLRIVRDHILLNPHMLGINLFKLDQNLILFSYYIANTERNQKKIKQSLNCSYFKFVSYRVFIPSFVQRCPSFWNMWLLSTPKHDVSYVVHCFDQSFVFCCYINRSTHNSFILVIITFLSFWLLWLFYFKCEVT